MADSDRDSGDSGERATASGLEKTLSRISKGTEVWKQVSQASQFVRDIVSRHPDWLEHLIDDGLLDRDLQENDLCQALNQCLEGVSDEKQMMSRLRQFRHQHLLRIAWRDIAGHTSVAQTLKELSWLAEACIDVSLQWLHEQLRSRFGQPLGRESGQPQSLIVLGMGKLGGQDLNFSSDIDLIFTYPDQGQTQGGMRCLSNEEYFIRLGQKLIQTLDQVTEDGFVYRVDMRLRPFGQQGRLALSFDAMEQYYQAHGRTWERYALLKARPVAGDIPSGLQLLRQLRPFIYRRYLDFGMLDGLRRLKQAIADTARSEQERNDLKLGPGGIREVEFVVQSWQLVYGGRYPDLQTSRIMEAMRVAVQYQLVTPEDADTLQKAYYFLRQAENRLQQYQDRQIHHLPDDKPARLRIAVSMGYGTIEAFESQLDQHRAEVSRHFEATFGDTSDQLSEERGKDRYSRFWTLIETADITTDTALEDDLAAFSAIQPRLQDFFLKISPLLSDSGRQGLRQLMPAVLEKISVLSEDQDEVLQRFLTMLKAISGRPNYLVLLAQNRHVLDFVFRCCRISRWLSRQMARHPFLLDSLIDHRQWLHDSDQDRLRADLVRILCGRDDMEDWMEGLRQFKLQQVFQIACQSIFSNQTVMQTATRLTSVAETILQEIFGRLWQELLDRSGQGGPDSNQSGLALIGYGKLGGREMGYASDLDLIVLYDPQLFCLEQSEGLRLVRRMMHVLSAYTHSGVLYEMDARLRPEGNSGLLMTSLQAFADYQKQRARLWEHQALLRARPVVGDVRVMQSFEKIRREVLTTIPQASEQLRDEILDMRRKMRENLDKSTDVRLDLKQGRNGMVDIEFLIQYWVLRSVTKCPQMLDETSMLGFLKVLTENGLIDQDKAEIVLGRYQWLRQQANEMALQEQPAILPIEKDDSLSISILDWIC